MDLRTEAGEFQIRRRYLFPRKDTAEPPSGGDVSSVVADGGGLAVSDRKSLAKFIAIAKAGRRWEREPTLRSIG